MTDYLYRCIILVSSGVDFRSNQTVTEVGGQTKLTPKMGPKSDQ